MKRVLRAAWEHLSLYLPILLMGVFALGTWWLVRNTPGVIEALTAQTVKHESDYFLRQFTIRTFNDKGQFKTELSGLQALHYPDTDTLDIEQARIRALNEEGGLTVATAQRAISNADGSDVQLLGNVHVLRTPQPAARGSAQPPMEYRGEFLHVLTRADRLQSHLPVVISRGADRFSGNTMSYDNAGSVIELQGQVRSTLTPRKTR